MISKEAQSAIEFMILVGAVLFLFVSFFGAVQGNIGDRIKEKRDITIKEIAINIQNEINLAFNSIEGYSRTFKLPSDINGLDYEIIIVERLVYVKTEDGKHAIALSIQKIQGDENPIEVNKGENLIKKQDGKIILNPVE